MTKTTATRIGPRMEEVVDYVDAHPGCTKLAAAEHVGPNGSRRFGYAAVNRTIAAGLVRADRLPNGHYRLTPAEVG